MSIAILTDSACDLNPQTMQELGIHMIHSRINVENTIRVDRLEISAEEVMDGILRSKRSMTTTPPSVQEFQQLYRRLLDQHEHVLSLHTSQHISPSVINAQQAAQPYGSLVTVLDTGTVSTGLGLRVLRAARLAARGATVQQIIQDSQQVAANAGTWFTVDTLRFLQLNGRIGSAAAVFGGLLGVKPTLAIQDGEIIGAGRTVGHRRAMQHLMDTLRYHVGRSAELRVAYLYAPGGEEYVQELRSAIADLNYQDCGAHPLGAAVAANAGPGAVGFSIEAA